MGDPEVLAPAANRIVLSEDLATSATTETPSPDVNPYWLAPQLGVPLALLAPLVNLPGRTLTTRAGRLLVAILGRYLHSIRVLREIENDKTG